LHNITEVTRRDIIDIIRNGFVGNEPQTKMDYYEREYVDERSNEYKICYYGRLEEIDFLSRLYNLKTMPSNDSRYRNAIGDIQQHTINNDDWEADWVFTDSRFQLDNGDDEIFLNFLCEMFNPVVRNETLPWHKFLEIFNELLKADGYELIEKSHISGRAVYGWKAIVPNSIEIKEQQTNCYELKLIGEGSYAQVFRYKDTFYNHPFVLKRAKKDLSPKELHRFKREFEQMKTLNSPYIVEVYSYNEDNQEYLMEFMDCTLDTYMSKNNGKLSFFQRKSIASQVLRAFKYIHSKDLLHRDICPKNVLVKLYDDIFVIKISDFGLVKIPQSKLTSVSTEYKGYFNDPELRLDGFNTYCIVHETYAITRLVFFIMTGRTNTEKISNPQLKEFVSIGLCSDKSKRYQDIGKLITSFNKITEL
jgi:tRNA A-37 threonylcarbamoyl transferase component Bud32